jgi:hypothetical protein|tara:strand:- start:1092 stop:1826 length:735 start_codon:yes stop_codon:yes gene_type:complete
MKKLLITLLALSTAYISAGQIWTQYDFRVDTPESAAKIVAASDELMASKFAKNNFKGSSHLDLYLANGSNTATHSFALLQPSMAAHQEWMTSLQNSPEGQKFFTVMNENSTPITERINSFLQSYGTASNDDVVWLIHQLNVKPSKVKALTRAFEKVDQNTKGDFPGQFGLSAVAFGQEDVTHLLTVGYSSIEEMESWEDQLGSNKAINNFWKTFDNLGEWKGNDLLINARIYDSALTIQEFLTN